MDKIIKNLRYAMLIVNYIVPLGLVTGLIPKEYLSWSVATKTDKGPFHAYIDFSSQLLST